MSSSPTRPLRAEKRAYSLRTGLGLLILLGVFVAAAVFVVTLFAFNFVIDRYYATDEHRTEREIRFYTDLQEYVTHHGLSSSDIKSVTEWVRRNPYVYLLISNDDELIFSSGENEEGGDLLNPVKPGTGITVDFPSEEELREYAESGSPYPLVFSDETVVCSLTEFTEYLYYDAANLVSLVMAVLAFSIIILVYFHRITRRITRLAVDVAVVADGDMSHAIYPDEQGDEISALTRHVEAMRSSIVSTLESEREAVNANTELITAMSHDIRTPLTVLLGYLDVMKLQEQTEESRTYLKAAEATALRLKELSDDMFRYFVAFGKPTEVSIQAYDAPTLLDQLLAEHILLLKEQGYTIQPEHVTELPVGTQLLTDAPQLMRMIDNIFSNIVKYADASQPIVLENSFDNDYIYLQFINNIRTDSAHVESTGIGLKTCSRIASAIGARFTVSKESGRFTVLLALPLAKKESAEALPVPSARPHRHRHGGKERRPS